MNQETQSPDRKTFLMLSVEKSSWVLPLLSIFAYSLVNLGQLSPLLIMGVVAALLATFVLGFVYGVRGINKFKVHRETSVLVQSILGVLLNVSFFALIIAIAAPAYIRAGS